MSAQLALLTAQADQLASKFPDMSRADLLKVAATVLGSYAQVTASAPRKRTSKTIDPEHQCYARVWGNGSGDDRCSKSQAEGSEYCKNHAAKHAECSEPCQLSETGKRLGLFCGDFRQPVTGKDTQGRWVITWEKNPEQMALMSDEKTNGTFQFHPWAPNSGEKAVAKKAAAPKKPKAPKVPKVPKAQGVKKPRGKNAYMCWLGHNRAEIKAELTASATDGKVSVTDVTKEAGRRWGKLSDLNKAPFQQEADSDKAAKIAAWEADQAAATTLANELNAMVAAPPASAEPAAMSLCDLDAELGTEEEEEEEEEEMEMEPFQYKDGTYFLTDVGGAQLDENWVISEDQGEDDECDPSEFIQLGTWTGDIKNPTVKMHCD
jgi:hypothetical protein